VEDSYVDTDYDFDVGARLRELGCGASSSSGKRPGGNPESDRHADGSATGRARNHSGGTADTDHYEGRRTQQHPDSHANSEYNYHANAARQPNSGNSSGK
jgi:hypothetical protein